MPTLVVAALSARQLAQSARRAGWNVRALDLFGDVDTVAAADAWHAIGDPVSLRIDGDRFLAALDACRQAADCIGWIAGAGFEPQTKLLQAGATILPLLGNDRATVDRVRDPGQFFTTLHELSIPHPETRLSVPVDTRGWLVKDFAASGAWHIRRADVAERANRPPVYFQRESPGRPMSVLFIGTGRRAHVIGINELLVRATARHPYLFLGAMGPIPLDRSLTNNLAETVEQLTGRFQLRGLASLDFLLDGDQFKVLEINARPTATLALYDRAEVGLLRLHVDACAGQLPDRALAIDDRSVHGEMAVFAVQPAEVTADHVRGLVAAGCHDVPQPGSHVAAGAPLCSVSASARSASVVRDTLAQHEASVLSMVQNRIEANHHAR